MIQWLLLTLLSVLIQGVFAFFEMGCVSYNKIRLQYDVSRGDKKAQWIQFLLSNPSRLFGTTLIGLNAALQIGSECARRFYESVHLDPDFAPITQVLIVVIFGELVPMFAARRNPEKAARSLAFVMINLSRLFSPITWAFAQMAKFIHYVMGKPEEVPLFLNREEIKLAFEERPGTEEEWLNVVNSLFQLKNTSAGQLMMPLSQVQTFPIETTVKNAREVLYKKYSPILPIYHRNQSNIVALSSVRDLVGLSDTDPILTKAAPPWFVTKDTSILRLLDQFRRNNQSAAVILDATGAAFGILTLDQIIDSIFGLEGQGSDEEVPSSFIHRTLAGSMKISEFNREFHASIIGEGSLSDLLLQRFAHPPGKGDSIEIDHFEFTVVEPSLMGVKTLTVRSL